jgi:RNA polymerase sigma-70 factor (ECF subfamily)
MEKEEVQTVLMRCPVAGRDILVLRYYQGLSVEEIAETVGCTVAAAKVRLHRARQTFKENYIATYGVDASEGRQVRPGNAAKRAR